MRRFLFFLFINLFLLTSIDSNAQENHGMPAVNAAVSERLGTSITKFEMEQNSPNPFAGFTDINFYNPVQGFVEFKIVNLIGKEVYRQVLEGDHGKNVIHVDGSDFMPGVYVYSLSNGSQTITRRMVISKK